MIQYAYRGSCAVFGWIWDWIKWMWQKVWRCIRCILHGIQWAALAGCRFVSWVWQQTGLRIVNLIWPQSSKSVEPDCQILDWQWQSELQKYKSIMLRPAVDCPSICQAIQYHLPKTDFVQSNDRAEMTVVVTIKTTRVQSDAESALERVNMYQDQRERTILLMFHKVMGSRTVGDVTSIMYQSPLVHKTFHVPFTPGSYTLHAD